MACFRVITKTKEELVLFSRSSFTTIIQLLVPGQSGELFGEPEEGYVGQTNPPTVPADLMRLSRQTPDKPVIEANEFSGPRHRVLNFVTEFRFALTNFYVGHE